MGAPLAGSGLEGYCFGSASHMLGSKERAPMCQAGPVELQRGRPRLGVGLERLLRKKDGRIWGVCVGGG